MSSNRGAFGCLLNGLAILFAILFVLSTVAVLFLFNVEQRLLQPALYKQALVEQDVYRRFPELVAKQLVYRDPNAQTAGSDGASQSDEAFIASIIHAASPALTGCLETSLGAASYADLAAASYRPTTAQIDYVKTCLRANGVPAAVVDTHEGMPVFFWMLSEQDWQAILKALLPESWLRAQTESVIDQVYAQVENGSAGPGITIDMVDFKARLKGDEGFNAIVLLIQAQPACTTSQVAQLTGLVDPDDPLKNVPVCRPPDAGLSLIYPNIRSALGLLADQIPDKADLGNLNSDSGSGSGSISDSGLTGSSQDPFEGTGQALGTFRVAILLTLLVPLVLLLLVVLCGARSIRGLLICLGIPVMVTGALAAVASLMGMAVTNAMIAGAVGGGSGSGGMDPEVQDLVVQIMGSIGRGYFSAVLVDGLILAVIGLGLVVVSFVVARARRGKLPPATYPNPGWTP